MGCNSSRAVEVGSAVHADFIVGVSENNCNQKRKDRSISALVLQEELADETEEGDEEVIGIFANQSINHCDDGKDADEDETATDVSTNDDRNENSSLNILSSHDIACIKLDDTIGDNNNLSPFTAINLQPHMLRRISLFPKQRSSSVLMVCDNDQRNDERSMLLEMAVSEDRSDAELQVHWDRLRQSIHDRIMTKSHIPTLKPVHFMIDELTTRARSDSVLSNISFLSSGFAGCNDVYNLLNSGVLNPYIHDPDYVVLVDVRTKEEFDAGHISSAQHISLLSPFFPMRCSNISFVIIYDNNGAEGGPATEYNEKLQYSGVNNACVLAGGYQKFKRRYPFMSEEHENMALASLEERMAKLTTFPSEIVVGKIYLGNRSHASSFQTISKLRITHILNVTMEEKNNFEESVTYLRLAVQDEPSQDLFKYFDLASNFIGKAIDDPRARILIHCTMGISRSTTCLTAYFIKECKWTLKAALDHIKDKRQGIRPNHGFLEQLLKWEELQLGEKTTNIDQLPF
eukprot:m.57121 g.57121  ORF g.57121 m.57121 type:complete len:516 (+) comp7821_c0_seq4:35-1582(+)